MGIIITITIITQITITFSIGTLLITHHRIISLVEELTITTLITMCSVTITITQHLITYSQQTITQTGAIYS